MKHRILSVLLSGILLITLFCGFSVSAASLPGDVNGDGETNTTDARLALWSAAKKCELNEAQRFSADVDGDGTVTTTDARLLLQYAAGILKDLVAPPAEPPQPDPEPTREEPRLIELGETNGRLPTQACLCRSLEELQQSFRSSDDKLSGYDTAFFENHALALLAFELPDTSKHVQFNKLSVAGNTLFVDAEIVTRGVGLCVINTEIYAIEFELSGNTPPSVEFTTLQWEYR